MKNEMVIAEADAWCEYWRREAFRKYPTPEAYEAVCKARDKWQQRAEILKNYLCELRDVTPYGLYQEQVTNVLTEAGFEQA